MTIVAFVPLLVAVVGVLVYALSTGAKLAEIGRLAYFAGLFVFLMVVANHVIRIGAP